MKVSSASAPSALHIRSAAPQRGTVLFITLIILVAMTLSGIALMRTVDTTAVIAGNMALKQGTLMATDLGVEAASQALKNLVIAGATESNDTTQNYSASYNPALASPTQLTASTANALEDVSNTGNTLRYWMERMCLATGPATASGCILEAGRDTPYYRVTTRAEGPRGTIAITQSTIQTPGQFVPQHALLTENRLSMSSTISVGGNAGNVHSNTRAQLSGTTVLTLATGTVSAGGSHTASGGTRGVHNSGSFTGGITEDAAATDIPVFNPADFAKYADFWLRKDGSVINRLGEVLMTAAQGQGGTRWLGWKCENCGSKAAIAIDKLPDPYTQADIDKLVTWTLEANNSYSTGLLYVEGHAMVATAPGNGSNGPSPWVISILATGKLRMNDATWQDYRAEPLSRWARAEIGPSNPLPPDVPTASQQAIASPDIPDWPSTPVISQIATQTPTVATNVRSPESIQNLGLVAGLDLFFDGTGVQSGPEALFTAREQIRINNYTLRGSVIASDKYSVAMDITENLVNGTTNITYNGNLSTPAIRGVSRRVSWRAIQQ